MRLQYLMSGIILVDGDGHPASLSTSPESGASTPDLLTILPRCYLSWFCDGIGHTDWEIPKGGITLPGVGEEAS